MCEQINKALEEEKKKRLQLENNEAKWKDVMEMN